MKYCKVDKRELTLFLAIVGILVVVASLESLVRARLALDGAHAEMDLVVSAVLMRYFQIVGIPIVSAITVYFFSAKLGMNTMLKAVFILLLLANSVSLIFDSAQSIQLGVIAVLLHLILIVVLLRMGRYPVGKGG